MSPHLNREQTEQYVLGALTPEASTLLEQHTLECAPCARILQDEALLDEQLREVARAPCARSSVVRPARWHKARLPALVGGLGAIAAAVLLLVPRPERTVPASPAEDFSRMASALELSSASERLVACPDPTSLDTCVAQAQARGLLVQYPEGAGEVPRYEGHAGFQRALAAGPSLL